MLQALINYRVTSFSKKLKFFTLQFIIRFTFHITTTDSIIRNIKSVECHHISTSSFTEHKHGIFCFMRWHQKLEDQSWTKSDFSAKVNEAWQWVTTQIYNIFRVFQKQTNCTYSVTAPSGMWSQCNMTECTDELKDLVTSITIVYG